MYHMYQLDAFTVNHVKSNQSIWISLINFIFCTIQQSCPADQDIINHYKLQQVNIAFLFCSNQIVKIFLENLNVESVFVASGGTQWMIFFLWWRSSMTICFHLFQISPVSLFFAIFWWENFLQYIFPPLLLSDAENEKARRIRNSNIYNVDSNRYFGLNKNNKKMFTKFWN